jgi:hypothetical protein
MPPTPELTNAWESPFLFVPLLILSIAFVSWAIFRRRSTRATASSTHAQVVLVPDVLRCVCGEPATDSAPIMARSRGDILRSYFGAPPRYKRSIDRMGVPVYCRSHAHLADVLMDQHVYDVRAEQAATNVSIAAKAANYERVGLPKAVADSLTEDEKKARRNSGTVTRLVAGG